MFLQVVIIATGNYNFFNLLTITLCFSLVDDVFLGKRMSRQSSFTIAALFQLVICLFLGSPSPPSVAERVSRAIFGRYGGMIYSAAKMLTFITVFGVMLALTVYYFDIKVDLKNFAMTSNISMNT